MHPAATNAAATTRMLMVTTKCLLMPWLEEATYISITSLISICLLVSASVQAEYSRQLGFAREPSDIAWESNQH